MRYLLNSELMQQADHFTIEEKGITALELMERAASECVRALEEWPLSISYVCVVCGTGNNGGDGFAIARMLRKKGIRVQAYLIGEESRCTQETRQQIKEYLKCGGVIEKHLTQGDFDVVIDALFGVGLNREVKGQYALAIEHMNASKGFKLAVDIPSGICADNGAVMGIAFHSDATVTFQVSKIGLEFYPGKEYGGKVRIVDIGIFTTNQQSAPEALCIYEDREYNLLWPRRPADSNKGTFGKVLIIAGSKGMSGAAYLCAKAAYFTGAGVIQIYTPEDNRVILQTLLPEAIIKTYDFFDEGELVHLLKWANIVSVGSGMSTSEKAWKLLKAVMERVEVPCLVDADGLNLLAEHKRYLESLPHKNFVFTPHMKEMERLTDESIEALRQRKVSLLRKFVEEKKVTCVLKDSTTIIASSSRKICMNTTGNAAMAKAGAGDVLAGIITGLMAQGLSCYDAGVLGAYIHGKAGDAAREARGNYSVMASDLISFISTAMTI